MIEVFMLVGLILCFNDILMQCHLEFIQRKKPANKPADEGKGELYKLKKQAIFDMTMNPGVAVFHAEHFIKQKQPV
jgi:hypothetical protein